MGSLFLLLKDMKNVRKHYQLGLDAEKKQLPMFLPYTSLNRDCLAFFINAERSSQAASGPTPGGVHQPSTYLYCRLSAFAEKLISVPQAPPAAAAAARRRAKRVFLMCGATRSGCVSVTAYALRTLCGGRA
jgi:hypothetical protein